MSYSNHIEEAAEKDALQFQKDRKKYWKRETNKILNSTQKNTSASFYIYLEEVLEIPIEQVDFLRKAGDKPDTSPLIEHI